MPAMNKGGELSAALRGIQRRLWLIAKGLGDRRRAEYDPARLLALDSDLGWGTLQSKTLKETLARSAQAMVRHVDAALARIWILDPKENVLELQASAGLYTHLDGAHSRIPVGQFKIGMIAQERKPHLTNNAIGDPRVHDQEWARREGLVAFAGYPLLFHGELMGVMAMFSTTPLSPVVLQVLSSIADRIAFCIDRMRAQEALQESEARYHAVFDQMAEGFALYEIMCDERGMPFDYRFLDINPAFERLTGLRRSDLLGRTEREVIPEEDAKWMRIHGEVALTGKPIHFDHFSPALKRHYEVLSYRPAPGHLAALLTDVTERKESERRMQQTQKMESIGLLAGGIAHEFNNILTGVIGNVTLALEQVGDEAKERLTTVLGEASRAAQLTQQLLAYAGRGQFVVTDLNVSDAVRHVAGLLRASVPEQIEVKLDLRDRIPHTAADPGQVQQVIFNLVVNSCEALGDDPGVITISTAVHSFEHPFTDATGQEIAPGNYVQLSVRDTGRGMDEATRSRIFDPFFTTKFTGRGLGLAAVSGIMRAIKGGITVDSTIGQGTAFCLYFRVSDPDET